MTESKTEGSSGKVLEIEQDGIQHHVEGQRLKWSTYGETLAFKILNLELELKRLKEEYDRL